MNEVCGNSRGGVFSWELNAEALGKHPLISGGVVLEEEEEDVGMEEDEEEDKEEEDKEEEERFPIAEPPSV